MKAVTIESLTFRYHAQTSSLLENVFFQLEQGQIAAITGPSGSGKSTLAHCIAGVIPRFIDGTFGGTITVAGRCGMVFQDPDTQIFLPTVEDELAFAPENYGVDWSKMDQVLTEVLDQAGLTHLRHDDPARLSGGQKQLVALGAVLTMQPKVLVLDETLAQIDVMQRMQMQSLLRNFCENGGSVVMIEHEPENVMFADTVWELRNGELHEIKCCLSVETRTSSVAPRRDSGREIIRVEQLHFSYPQKQFQRPKIENQKGRHAEQNESVINDVSLTLHKGEVTSLTGRNGSGKTTFGKLLTGMLEPTSGTVLIEEMEASPRRLAQIGRSVGYCFQNPTNQLFARTVEEEIAFALRYRGVSTRLVKERTEELLEVFGLSQHRHAFPLNLSFGERRRLALAAVMAPSPAYLILDEPTVGLDVENIAILSDLLQAMKKQGVGMLLISHNESFRKEQAERTLVLKEGGTIHEL